MATSNSASVSNASSFQHQQTVTTGGATAKGTEAVQTVVNLEFLNNSGQMLTRLKLLIVILG